jgi:histidinol-phosphate aminotransferase
MIPRRVLETLPPYHPGKKKPGTIKLSSNENPRGPSPKAVSAAREALDQVAVYPEGSSGELREALARRDIGGARFSPEQFIVGNGSDEVMVMIAAAYVEAGDRVVTGAHTFSQYSFAGRLFGGEVIETPMPEGRFDIDAIVEAAQTAKLVFVCSPNNPTGAYLTEKEMSRLVEEIPDSVLLVVDEAYSEYVDADDFGWAERLVASRKNLVVLHTFSKIFGLAALRVGYGVGSPEVISNLYKVKQPFNVGSVAQTAALAALSDQDFVRTTLKINQTSKVLMERFFRSNGISYLPTQGNFFCIDLGTEAEPIVAALADRGFSVRPLRSFGLPNKIRVTIGSEEQAAGFCDALSFVSKPALA